MSDNFIDLSGVDLEDRHEETTVEAGTEAQLRIVSFLKDKDKNGKNYIMPFFEIVDEPYSKEFGDYMPLPSSDMSPKEMNKAKNRIAAFAEAFDIVLTGTIDVKNDLVGKTGWAILGIGKDQNDEDINKVRRYVNN